MTKKKRHDKTRSGKKDDIERKRDERARRVALRRERKAKDFYSLQDDEDYVSFCNQLQAVGLKIKDIPGDGNCLFRSLSDQLQGDHNKHGDHRQETVRYMRNHLPDFEPFHLEEKPFLEYLEDLEKDGTFAGNDAIVAFARNNKVDVIIHQFNNPRFVINGRENPQNVQLHVAYHNGEHYSSLRRLDDNTDDPAYIRHVSGQKNHQMLQPPKASLKGKFENTNQQPKKRLEKLLASTDACAVTSKCPATVTETSDLAEGSTAVTPQSHTAPDECTDIERKVMESTSCKDVDLVKKALEDNDFDFGCTVTYLLQIMSLEEETSNCYESSLMAIMTSPKESLEGSCDQSRVVSKNVTDKLEESHDGSEQSRDKMDESCERLDESREISDKPRGLSEESSDSSAESHGKLGESHERPAKSCERLGESREVTAESHETLECSPDRNDESREKAEDSVEGKHVQSTKDTKQLRVVHQSNRQRKQLAKQEKKNRRQQEQKQQVKDKNKLIKDVGQVNI